MWVPEVWYQYPSFKVTDVGTWSMVSISFFKVTDVGTRSIVSVSFIKVTDVGTWSLEMGVGVVLPHKYAIMKLSYSWINDVF